jgi:hypothetical protein
MNNTENFNSSSTNIPILSSKSDELAPRSLPNQVQGGFAKVMAGGRIIRLQNDKPFLQRMVTGQALASTSLHSGSNSLAVLDSIKSNLEAGIDLVDTQETALAKIGGKLSEIALVLNQARSPKATNELRTISQQRFQECRNAIRSLALQTYDGTALFSHGKSKPITLAIPAKGRWEGISIDRADLGQPGLITVDQGKVSGESPGYLLDAGSVRRACDEWRALCISNRMQWGLLADRLRGIVNCLLNFDHHRPWKIPESQNGKLVGPLRRPNQNN